MLKTGFTLFGQRIWNEQEDFACKLFFPDYLGLQQILYSRSSAAIKAHCRKLGLVRPRHSWTPLERQKLRKLYPTASREEICLTFPNIDWENIQAMARYYGYRRKKKPYKITGVVALDQTRVQCYNENVNMRELDEECRTKRYFQTRGYRSKYPDFKAINRAVKWFGGQMEVRWGSEFQ
ncbi:MAG: hypothetical protein JWM58_2540 [Rhizobium sp.]|nr:hypothetical protein [Rhizobium sp.]